jgi:hypothetical protein
MTSDRLRLRHRISIPIRKVPPCIVSLRIMCQRVPTHIPLPHHRPRLAHLRGLQSLRDVVLRPYAGEQVDEEGKDVEGEDEGDEPLEDGGSVAVAGRVADAETDGHSDFDQDEGELDPEGDAEHAVVAVVDPEALVLCADEDGGDDVAGTTLVECVSIEFIAGGRWGWNSHE